MLQLNRPICFIDLETTGTDIKEDRIVEISICKQLENGDREIKTRRINPGIPIPKAASDVHGITDELVKDAPAFKQVAAGILSFIKDCDIAGFNSNRFDVPLLYAELSRAGVEWDYTGIHFIDAGNIYKRKEERTLSAAYQFYCGRALDGAHSAEVDILATADVFFAQLDKYEDLPQEVSELALYSNFDKEVIDLSGSFSKDESGFYIFNFGKHKGKRVINNLDYLNWMLTASFPKDTRNIINKILEDVITEKAEIARRLTSAGASV